MSNNTPADASDVMTDVNRDDGGKWYVICVEWDTTTSTWKSADRLTGFTTRKAAVEAARTWRREHGTS